MGRSEHMAIYRWLITKTSFLMHILHDSSSRVIGCQNKFISLNSFKLLCKNVLVVLEDFLCANFILQINAVVTSHAHNTLA